ncbi:hypothetical protein ABH935_007059 [Catenulispora sp. GAS73]|uniref:hypothetical protein n=1 Tax=Catenulispora sp. GAS73 TaxID=3156269 RepID=UPI003515E7B7
MQNNTTPENTHPAITAGRATAGGNRPPRTKGIDLPTTVCFNTRGTSNWTHTQTGSDNGVLPDWAVSHLIDEYLRPGYSAILLETRRPKNLKANFQQFYSPARREYGRFGTGPTGLAVIEGRPRPARVSVQGYRESSQRSGVGELLGIVNQVRSLVVNGGIVAVALERPAPGPGFTDVTSQAINIARRAGFLYLQHLAVIDADVTGDAIATPADAVVLADVARQDSGTRVHPRVHHDVLIFTNTTRKGAA